MILSQKSLSALSEKRKHIEAVLAHERRSFAVTMISSGIPSQSIGASLEKIAQQEHQERINRYNRQLRRIDKLLSP